MTAADIARLDVPTAELAAQIEALAAAAVLIDASTRTHSPSDRIAYLLDLALLAHPERCSTDADYPAWTPGRAA